MVGRDVAAPVARAHARPATTVVRDRQRPRVAACATGSTTSTLPLRAGEITAIAGVSGNGQQALADAAVRHARAGIRHGVASPAARLPAEPRAWIAARRRAHSRGSARGRRRSATCRCGRTRSPSATRTAFARAGLVRRRAARAHARDIVERFDVRAARGIDAPARSLSGGNMQKLILGRALRDRLGDRDTAGAHRRRPADVGPRRRRGRVRASAAARRARARRRGAADLRRPRRDLRARGPHRGDARGTPHRGEAGERVDARRRSGSRWRASARGSRCALRPSRRVVALVLVAAPFAAIAFTLVVAALFVAWAGAPVGAHLRADLRGRLRLALRVERDADARHAADPHRARRRGRVSRALLQHRRGRPALRGRARRRRGRRRMAARLPPVAPVPVDDASPRCSPARCCCSVPALLRTRLGVDEVVTTLLLNFIVLLFVSMMLDGPMKDPAAMGWPQSVSLPDELQLGKLIERTRVHTGLADRAGAGGRAVGAPAATRRSASPSARSAPTRAPRRSPACRCTRTLVMVALLSGALAGLAGAHRSRGPHRLRHARHVARLRLQRHRHRDARGAQSARRRGRRDLRRGRAGRRRQHEPRGRGADVHRRRHRRDRAALDAGRDGVRVAIGCAGTEAMLDVLDRAFSPTPTSGSRCCASRRR